MRFPVAVAASIFSIALYFTLFWGFEGMWVLTSPLHGLEDAWRTQIVYWVARSVGLGPSGLLHLAAGFGLFKLAVAGVLSVHIIDRIRCLPGGKPDADILEFGLLLVVIASIATVAPAIWEHDAGMIRTNTMHLVLASVAAALSAVERMKSAPKKDIVMDRRLAAVMGAVEPDTMDKPRTGWFTPWR